jgi:hypothetical protein
MGRPVCLMTLLTMGVWRHLDAVTTAYLQGRELATGKLLGSAKALTGTPHASAAALDSAGSLWLGGSYTDALDLGNQNALSSALGVFLLRLDRAP